MLKKKGTRDVMNQAVASVDSALDMFTKAKNQIMEANKSILDAINKDKEKVYELEANIIEGKEIIEENTKVLEKLSQFTKGE